MSYSLAKEQQVDVLRNISQRDSFIWCYPNPHTGALPPDFLYGKLGATLPHPANK
jgi:hypothetical protein